MKCFQLHFISHRMLATASEGQETRSISNLERNVLDLSILGHRSTSAVASAILASSFVNEDVVASIRLRVEGIREEDQRKEENERRVIAPSRTTFARKRFKTGGPLRQRFHIVYDDGNDENMSLEEALRAIRIHETMENDEADQRGEEEAEAEVLENLVSRECTNICELHHEDLVDIGELITSDNGHDL